MIKRDFDREVGTPIGVTEQSPESYQDRVIWATRFSKDDMAEIEHEAEKFAYKLVDGHADMFRGREDEARARAAEKRKLELMRNAHDYKLSLVDLDKNIYAFDKVFDENGQPSRYVKDLQEFGEDALGEEIAEEAPLDRGVGMDVSNEQASDVLDYIKQNFDGIWNETQSGQKQIENETRIEKPEKFSKDPWYNIPFNEQIDNYNDGKYKSGKFFAVGSPSEKLASYGIDKYILMTEGF